jgi:hypothetical protein
MAQPRLWVGDIRWDDAAQTEYNRLIAEGLTAREALERVASSPTDAPPPMEIVIKRGKGWGCLWFWVGLVVGLSLFPILAAILLWMGSY